MDLVAAIVIEKQVTAQSETVTGVPSEELYSSSSSPLTQQWTMYGVLGFPKCLNLSPDL
jgi:hypothetical protein